MEERGYVLCTLHRQENTDNPERLTSILAALRDIAQEQPVILPLHPRTRTKLTAQHKLPALGGLNILAPLPYLEMQRLQMSASDILTDSGGMQKEACFHGVPCITLRDETEWVETVEAGWNQLVGADKEQIISAYRAAKVPDAQTSNLYGDGNAAQKIINILGNL